MEAGSKLGASASEVKVARAADEGQWDGAESSGQSLTASGWALRGGVALLTRLVRDPGNEVARTH